MRRRQTTVNMVFIRTGIRYLLPRKKLYGLRFKRTRLYVKLFPGLIWLKAVVKIFFKRKRLNKFT